MVKVKSLTNSNLIYGGLRYELDMFGNLAIPESEKTLLEYIKSNPFAFEILDAPAPKKAATKKTEATA